MQNFCLEKKKTYSNYYDFKFKDVNTKKDI